MPGFTGSHVAMYNPSNGVTIPYGETGPSSASNRPALPITPIVTSTQSGHTEYVVVCQSPTSGLIVMQHAYDTLVANSETQWNTFLWTGTSSVNTAVMAYPIDLISDPRPTVSATVYTYDTSGYIWQLTGFSSSGVWNNITPSTVTGGKLVPVASYQPYNLFGPGKLTNDAGSVSYMRYMTFDGSGALYALYFRPILPATSGCVLSVQRWTGAGTTWTDLTSGNSMIEHQSFGISNNTSFGVFGAISGNVILSSPYAGTSGNSWIAYNYTGSSWGSFVPYPTGYGIAQATTPTGVIEQFTLAVSAAAPDGFAVVKLGGGGATTSGSLIYNASSGDIYNIGGISGEPTNAITVTLFPSRSPT